MCNGGDRLHTVQLSPPDMEEVHTLCTSRTELVKYEEGGMCFQYHRSSSISGVVGGSGQTVTLTTGREAECVECGMQASMNNASTQSKVMSKITYITINEASLERVKHALKII